MPTKDFGENLKRERQSHGITRPEMAERVQISISSLGAYERGEKTPPVDVAERIADTMGLSVDYLLGRTRMKELQGPDSMMYLSLALTENGCSTETVLKIIGRYKELSGT